MGQRKTVLGNFQPNKERHARTGLAQGTEVLVSDGEGDNETWSSLSRG